MDKYDRLTLTFNLYEHLHVRLNFNIAHTLAPTAALRPSSLAKEESPHTMSLSGAMSAEEYGVQLTLDPDRTGGADAALFFWSFFASAACTE
jgi:hypothetical protein